MAERKTPILNGRPIDEPPASLDDAKAERERLLDELRDLDAQLGDLSVSRRGERLHVSEYNDWKRRAMYVRRLTERRYRFLKQWIAEQNTSGVVIDLQRDDHFGIAATSQARQLARRISGIEAIAVAAVAFVLDQSPANLAELTERVNRHAEGAGIVIADVHEAKTA